MTSASDDVVMNLTKQVKALVEQVKLLNENLAPQEEAHGTEEPKPRRTRSRKPR